MGQIASQLGQLLLQSLPTVIFVFLLLVILDRLFFRAVLKVLREREEATTGALARAGEQTAAANAKAADYEAALQAARQEIYRLREADRRQALAEREALLQGAREQAEALVRRAEAEVAAEVEIAKRELASVSRSLAESISEILLGGPEPPAGGTARGRRA